MQSSSSFFSMKAGRQPVNSTLVGIFLASWCLWTVVYYVSQSVDTVTEVYKQQQASVNLNNK